MGSANNSVAHNYRKDGGLNENMWAQVRITIM